VILSQVIRDSTGHEETVTGPGVIGLYPRMYPGCPLFTYESCSPIATATGTMYGR
jgi:uncharacterized protein affecting Mg2+/Co2+ transport